MSFSHSLVDYTAEIYYELIDQNGSTVAIKSFISSPYINGANQNGWAYADAFNIENAYNLIKFSFIPQNGVNYKIKVTVKEGKRVGFWANFFNNINFWVVVGTYETNTSKLYYNNANPNFILSSQMGIDGGGRPISCRSNVSINGNSSSCESKYLLEVIETDAYWTNYLNADYAGKWFNVPVSNIDLQWFTANYGNPVNGDPVNGPTPTAYDGFEMKEKNVTGSNGQPNFYIIKISVLQNVWKSKQMLIDVDGSCKTSTVEMFDPNTMTPMSDEEIAELLNSHGLPNYFENSSDVVEQQQKLHQDPIIYPNPAFGLATIKHPEEYKLQNILVTNIYGRMETVEIETKENFSHLDLTNLSKGFYFVRISYSDHLTTLKLQVK